MTALPLRSSFSPEAPRSSSSEASGRFMSSNSICRFDACFSCSTKPGALLKAPPCTTDCLHFLAQLLSFGLQLCLQRLDLLVLHIHLEGPERCPALPGWSFAARPKAPDRAVARCPRPPPAPAGRTGWRICTSNSFSFASSSASFSSWLPSLRSGTGSIVVHVELPQNLFWLWKLHRFHFLICKDEKSHFITVISLFSNIKDVAASVFKDFKIFFPFF